MMMRQVARALARTLAVGVCVTITAREARAQSSTPDSLPAEARGAGAHVQPVARSGFWSWFDRDRTFSLLDENDAFAASDSSYTQGLRFAWEFGVWPRWLSPWFDALSGRQLLGGLAPNAPVVGCEPRLAAEDRKRRACGSVRLSLGQTIYTPPDITVDTLITAARPYSGYLFGSLGAVALYERAMVTSELTVGLLGPGAAAQATQSLAHWTWSWGSDQPMGWHHQLRNAPQVTLRNTWTASLIQLCWKGCDGSSDEIRLFDVLPTAEVVVGTLMNRASLGGSVRAGWRFPDLASAERIGTTRPPEGSAGSAGDKVKRTIDDLLAFARTRTWVMGFAGHDQRFVAHNALLSGSYRDGGAGGWREQSRIETRHSVGETYLGLAAGLGRLSVAWQRIERSAEYTPNGGSHRFGSITVTLASPVR
jgi:hypothetical protein